MKRRIRKAGGTIFLKKSNVTTKSMISRPKGVRSSVGTEYHAGSCSTCVTAVVEGTGSPCCLLQSARRWHIGQVPPKPVRRQRPRRSMLRRAKHSVSPAILHISGPWPTPRTVEIVLMVGAKEHSTANPATRAHFVPELPRVAINVRLTEWCFGGIQSLRNERLLTNGQ